MRIRESRINIILVGILILSLVVTLVLTRQLSAKKEVMASVKNELDNSKLKLNDANNELIKIQEEIARVPEEAPVKKGGTTTIAKDTSSNKTETKKPSSDKSSSSSKTDSKKSSTEKKTESKKSSSSSKKTDSKKNSGKTESNKPSTKPSKPNKGGNMDDFLNENSGNKGGGSTTDGGRLDLED